MARATFAHDSSGHLSAHSTQRRSRAFCRAGYWRSAGRTGFAGTSLMSLRRTSMCGDPRSSQYPTRHARDQRMGRRKSASLR